MCWRIQILIFMLNFFYDFYFDNTMHASTESYGSIYT